MLLRYPVYIFRLSRSSSYIEVIGSRSKSRDQKGQTSITRCIHSRVVCLRLKGSLTSISISISIGIIRLIFMGLFVGTFTALTEGMQCVLLGRLHNGVHCQPFTATEKIVI